MAMWHQVDLTIVDFRGYGKEKEERLEVAKDGHVAPRDLTIVHFRGLRKRGWWWEGGRRCEKRKEEFAKKKNCK